MSYKSYESWRRASPVRHRVIAWAAGLGTFVAACGSSAPAASLPAEWQHEQRLEAPAPGLLKLSLPAATLDAARPALKDLRLYDDSGIEVPYLIERPKPAGKSIQPAKSFQVSVNTTATVLILETSLTQPLDGVTLETPARTFLKAVQIEGSADGNRWQTLARGQPIFRQPGGVSQLLAADQAEAALAAEEQLKKSWGEGQRAGKGGVVFWGILAVVVVALLIIISRLLPQTPRPE